jgi:hypothetical protein
MKRLLGTVLILIGLFFGVGGIISMVWRNDADLSRSGMVAVGLAYTALGLVMSFGGWRLFRRSR